MIPRKKKSHTCEEGGTHPQNFCLAFIDELEKQLLKQLLKQHKLLKWDNKKM